MVRGRLVKFTLKESDSGRTIFYIEHIQMTDKKFESFVLLFPALNLLNKRDDIETFIDENVGEDYASRFFQPQSSNIYRIKCTYEELPEILTDGMVNTLVKKVASLDKRMRKNREKLQKNSKTNR